MTPKFVQVKKTTLVTNVTTEQTESIILARLEDIYDNQLVMEDFGEIGYLTLNPQNSNEEIISFTDFERATNGNVTLLGVERGLRAKSPYDAEEAGKSHNAGNVVVSSNNVQVYQALVDFMLSIGLSGGSPATLTSAGFGQLASANKINEGQAIGSSTAPLLIAPNFLQASRYGLNLPNEAQKVFLNAITGMLFPYTGQTAPAGFLMADGEDYLINNYPALAGVLRGNYGLGEGEEFTVTTSSNTITSTDHQLADGDMIFFTSSNTLPAGLVAGQMYFVIDVTVNTFKVSTSVGGTEVDITSTGSGTHRFHVRFRVPNLLGSVPVGTGKKEINLKVDYNPTQTIASITSSNNSGNSFNFSSSHGLQIGDIFYIESSSWTGSFLQINRPYIVTAVPNSTTARVSFSLGGNEVNIGNTSGLTTVVKRMGHISINSQIDTYENKIFAVEASLELPSDLEAGEYKARISNNRLYLADGNSPVLFNDGDSKTFKMKMQSSAKDHNLGEEDGFSEHQLTEAEMPSHNHRIAYRTNSVSGNTGVNATTNGATSEPFSSGNRGGDQPHNNMQPYTVVNWIIKT